MTSPSTPGLRPLAELRAIAEKATPESWRFVKIHGYALDQIVSAGQTDNLIADVYDLRATEYIAAFDPPTVLSLLTRIEELEEALTPFAKIGEALVGRSVEYTIKADGRDLNAPVVDASDFRRAHAAAAPPPPSDQKGGAA